MEYPHSARDSAPRRPTARFSGARLLRLAPIVAISLLLTEYLPQLGFVFGREDVAPTNEYACKFRPGPIVIDGRADEAAWKTAIPVNAFGIPWAKNGGKTAPEKAARAKMLWDREYIYIFADLDDADLFADVTEHDGMTWDNDVFEMFFKPDAKAPGYYEFQVNAAGTVMDLFIPGEQKNSYPRLKNSVPFHIESKVALRGTLNKHDDQDQGWSVELRIPWKDFTPTGGRPDPAALWTFALCRYDYTKSKKLNPTGAEPELSSTAPLKQMSFHRHQDYAPLRFVGPEAAPGSGGLTRRESLTTSKTYGTPDPPSAYVVRKAFPKMKLSYPVAMERQPGSNRMLFLQETSPYSPTTVHRMVCDPETTTYEDLPNPGGTAYDIEFHPKFAENGYVYFGLNKSKNGGPNQTRVIRYTMDRKEPYRVDPLSETEIIAWDSDGHNGGAITFGLDGMMYVTSGDGTSDSDRNLTGQDLSKPLAKVLRIDVDHPENGRMYGIPKDNPFVNRPDARGETWAFGLRNPWRITTDPVTGHIWVGNNGQDLWEQVYFIRKGENYGWSVMEGGHPFYLNRKRGPGPIIPPAADHPHSVARSLTGGVVYYGKRLPELKGAYIYADYSTGKIWGIRHDGKSVTWHEELIDTPMQITGFGFDLNGELLIADHQGEGKANFHTLEHRAKGDTSGARTNPAFPKLLSETGLFRNIPNHVTAAGVVPYSVNSPLWSDGTYKVRFFAVPDNAAIGYTSSRGWNFPDDSVIIKSFALEREEGKPQTRRWIETRLMVKSQGEWAGYSYRWNNDQSDAQLVDREGFDATYTVNTPKGKREQTWHYPGRTECMVCHSRAANYVLGLCEIQMNKDQDYGNGAPENQIRALERLGYFGEDLAGPQRATLSASLKRQSTPEAKEILNYLATYVTPAEPKLSHLFATAPDLKTKLVNPLDPREDLEVRARSYLHANCAHCHIDAGGGNAQFDVDFSTRRNAMKLIDVPPVHDAYKIPNPRIIAPGDPDRSVLLRRISNREKGHMPPVATVIVDDAAVKVIREWILNMKK